MSSLARIKNRRMICLLIVGILSVTGCLDYDDSASDLGYYQPYIYATYDWINLTSLSETLNEHNISNRYDPFFSNGQIIGLWFNFSTNETYIISNITYEILAPIRVSFKNDILNEHIWMNIELDDKGHPGSEYRYSSREEAQNATPLLVPGWDLVKYFLKESSNPMPDKVEYPVRF